MFFSVCNPILPFSSWKGGRRFWTKALDKFSRFSVDSYFAVTVLVESFVSNDPSYYNGVERFESNCENLLMRELNAFVFAVFGDICRSNLLLFRNSEYRNYSYARCWCCNSVLNGLIGRQTGGNWPHIADDSCRRIQILNIFLESWINRDLPPLVYRSQFMLRHSRKDALSVCPKEWIIREFPLSSPSK